MITTAAYITLGMVALAGVLFLFQLIRSRTVANRMVALDAILLAVVAGIAVDAARTGRDTYLNVMVVTALLAFTGTALVARFIARRGR